MSTVKVEVHSTEIETISGVSKATGKPYEMHKQVAWLHLPDEPFPTKIKLSLENDTPLHKGIYSLDPVKLLTVGSFDSVGFDDRKLAKSLVLSVQPSASPTAPGK